MGSALVETAFVAVDEPTVLPGLFQGIRGGALFVPVFVICRVSEGFLKFVQGLFDIFCPANMWLIRRVDECVSL